VEPDNNELSGIQISIFLKAGRNFRDRIKTSSVQVFFDKSGFVIIVNIGHKNLREVHYAMQVCLAEYFRILQENRSTKLQNQTSTDSTCPRNFCGSAEIEPTPDSH